MAGRRNLNSVSTPIILGAVSVPLSLALLVGWTLLIAKNLATYGTSALDVWLLVLGAVSFVVIVVVLLLQSAYLARQIVEVRRQDSFIDSVTHELKSPLASLKLCLDTMARPQVGQEKREHLRTMMLRDVDRLTSFIDDVLQASRLATSDRVGLSIGVVPLRETVGAITALVAARHGVSSDEIEVDVPNDLGVATDAAALEIVLKNLLDNAVKYSQRPARVQLVARREGHKSVVIEVTDQGIGLAAGELKHIFKRFYRVPSEEVRSRKGTGLGLFVASALVENMGGTIEAASPGPGAGSTMRLRLPDQRTVAPRSDSR